MISCTTEAATVGVGAARQTAAPVTGIPSSSDSRTSMYTPSPVAYTSSSSTDDGGSRGLTGTPAPASNVDSAASTTLAPILADDASTSSPGGGGDGSGDRGTSTTPAPSTADDGDVEAPDVSSTTAPAAADDLETESTNGACGPGSARRLIDFVTIVSILCVFAGYIAV